MTLLECTIFPGGFSGELKFQVKLGGERTYTGLAARQYFWDKLSGKPVEQPSIEGIDGYVAVRILVRKLEEEDVLVSVPDGEVLKLNRSRIISIPEPSPHVPIGS